MSKILGSLFLYLAIGAGVYYAVTADLFSSLAGESSGFQLVLPGGNAGRINEPITIAWRFSNEYLSALSTDFDAHIFLSYERTGGGEPLSGVIGDGYRVAVESTQWTPSVYIGPGEYRITGEVSITPKDPARLCARTIDGACAPSEADAAVLARAQRIKPSTVTVILAK